MDIEAGTNLRIAAKNMTTFWECANTDVTQCQYSQVQDSMPEVTAVTIEGAGQIQFVGTGFQKAGYQANTTFGGVYADSTTVTSDVLATATWTKGVPVVMNAT